MRNMGILDGSYKDEIRNLDNSPRLVFINEECGNLIVVDDDGELTIIITTRRKSHTFYNNTFNHVAYLLSISQLGEHDFSCGLIVNNLF